MFAFRSIIIVTTQFMSPALHKNFSEADFDFKVSYWSRWGLGSRFRKSHHKGQMLFNHSVFDTQSFNLAFYWPFFYAWVVCVRCGTPSSASLYCTSTSPVCSWRHLAQRRERKSSTSKSESYWLCAFQPKVITSIFTSFVLLFRLLGMAIWEWWWLMSSSACGKN